MLLLYLSGNIEILEEGARWASNKTHFKLASSSMRWRNSLASNNMLKSLAPKEVLGHGYTPWEFTSKAPRKNMEKTTRKQTSRMEMRRLKTTRGIDAGHVLIVSHDPPLAGWAQVGQQGTPGLKVTECRNLSLSYLWDSPASGASPR